MFVRSSVSSSSSEYTEERKRKRIPGARVNDPLKQKRVSDDDISDRISVISFAQFQHLLGITIPDSINAIERLKKKCTLIKDESSGKTLHHRLWIKIPRGELGSNKSDIWLDLTITKENSEYHIDIDEDGSEPKTLFSAVYDQKSHEFSSDFFKGRQVSKETSRQLSDSITRFLTPTIESGIEVESDVESDSIKIVTVEELIDELNKTKPDYKRRFKRFKKLFIPIEDSDGIVSYRLWIELGQDRWWQMFLKEESNGNININIFDCDDESNPLATLKIDRENRGDVSYTDEGTLELITKIANHLTFLPKSDVEKEKKSDSTSFEDFQSLLSNETSSFIAAWNALTDLGSPNDQNAQFSLRITMSEDNVFNLILSQGNYFSTSMTEKELYPKSFGKNSYYYLKIFLNSNFTQPVLSMRLDVNGSAELIWLEKSKSLSGNEMKKLAYDFAKYFKVKKLFLHDDAKIKLRITPPTFSRNLPGDTLAYRKPMYLSTIKSIASDQGDTWYTSDGFTPLKCKNLAIFNKSEQANQNPHIYFTALEYIRKMDLSKMSNEIFTEYSHLIHAMHKKYCSPIAFDQATFHDLMKSMHAKLIESQDEKREIVSDFAALYENFLEPTQRVKANVEMAKWKLAIEVINEHYIFVKDFQATKIENYAEFTTKAHTTFSELVNDLKLHELTYSKLCQFEI